MHLRRWLLAIALVWVAPARGEDRVALARSHFIAGETAFRAGNYEVALIEFQTGYDLVPRPEFLLDLGNTLRKLNRLAEARARYEAYLKAEPDSPHAARVREVLATMHAEEQPPSPPGEPRALPTATTPATTATTPATTAMTPTVPPTTPASRETAKHERTPVYKRWWLWTLVGVVAVGGAVTLAVLLTRSSGFQPNLPTIGPGVKPASLPFVLRF